MSEIVMTVIFILLVAFQVKHYLADYPLQNSYMLGKFKPTGWVLPLAAHCGVHAAFTLMIIAIMQRLDLWWLALVDFGIHFVMDRVKASPNLMGRWKALSGSEYSFYQKQYEVFTDVANSTPIIFKDVREKYLSLANEVQDKFRNNTFFWYALGFDQMVHHLTHYYIIWMLVQ